MDCNLFGRYFLLILVICCAAVTGNSQYPDEEPDLKAFPFYFNIPVQDGSPVPLPKSWTKSATVFTVRNEGFRFNATGNTCDDLEAAFDRYFKMIFDTPAVSQVTIYVTLQRNNG